MGAIHATIRNTPWLSAVVALVVLPSLAPDTFGLSCPHHSGAHEEQPSDQAAPHAAEHPGEQPEHAGHAGGDGVPAPASGSAPAPGHGGHGSTPCTCAGNCPVSGTITLATTATLPSPEASWAFDRPLPEPNTHHPFTPPHLLPFANGPPRA